MNKEKSKRKLRNRRNHDGFLKYIYSRPQNTRALFRIAAKKNKVLREILSEVDLDTLEEISGAYNDVGERGEADLAFRVKSKAGEDIIFGILLEHKSSPSDDIFAQIGRYTLRVMVNKSNPELASLPTKAIVIYNGTDKWDPLEKYRSIRAKYKDRVPNFEFAFVNLAEIDDEICLADENVEAAVGIITMKYAFKAGKYGRMLPMIEERLKTISMSDSATLISKIELYLGEYVTRTSLKRLKMAFQSIGQRLGFVSAGDVRRSMEKEVRSLRAKNAAQVAKIKRKDAELASKDAEIAALKAQLAASANK